MKSVVLRSLRGAYLDTISAEGAAAELCPHPTAAFCRIPCFEGVVDNSYRGQNSNMHMCEARALRNGKAPILVRLCVAGSVWRL